MRKPVAPSTAYHLINHGPCNLITTGDGARRNVAPINWTMPIQDEPPLVLMAVEPGIFTDELLKAHGEFAVNVMGEKHAPQMLFCGRRTGRETDKFRETGLTPVACAAVKPPRLAESLAHLECRVVKVIPWEGIIPPPASTPEGSPAGDQAGGGITLYVGEVKHAEAEEEVFDGKTWRPENGRTLHHLGGGVFTVTERVIEVPKPK